MEGKMRKTAIFFLTVLFTFPCYSAVITVDDDGPADFDNIQAAINIASPGDVIIVEDGTYTGGGNINIRFLGKAITLQSANGPSNCTIKAQGNSRDKQRVFYFQYREGADSVLEGFTITGGYEDEGSGIYCRDASPTIKNCIIKDNVAREMGGGICCIQSTAVITGCVIKDNTAPMGGGIYNKYLEPFIRSCLFVGNSAQKGGGVCFEQSTCGIYNCNFFENSASYGGGLYSTGTSTVTVKNCIFWANDDHIGTDSSSSVSVTYCDVQGGWAGVGNIDKDPMFVNYIGGEYHLKIDSPCVNAGDPAYPADPCETDIDGEPRVVNGIVDIGIDEINAEGPIMVVQPKAFGFHCSEPGEDPQNHHYPEKIYISNRSPQILNWQIQKDCDWLNVSPATGQTTTETDEVMLNFDTSALAYGTHKCRLVITDEDAINNPVTVKVVLRIGPALYVPSGSYPTIQSAINAADDGDTVVVMPGTYTGPGNYNIDFLGKKITVSSIEPNDPDVVAATVVVYDSDVDMPHSSVFNFRHQEEADSVLSGFTIMCKGSQPSTAVVCGDSSPAIANCVITSEPGNDGRGINLYNSNVRIINCTITGFLISNFGAGIYCCGAHDPFYYPYPRFGPEIIKCRIIGNWGREGGGIFLKDCTCEIVGTLIADNQAYFRGRGSGGGLRCLRSIVTLKNSTIKDNTAGMPGTSEGQGGGIYAAESRVRLFSSAISGNSTGDGGGIFLDDQSSLGLHNCTICSNSAGQRGGAVYCDGGQILLTTNCILWGNTAPLCNHIGGGRLSVHYSCIQDYDPNDADIPYGGQANGNIDDDPGFVGWPDDLHLGIESPCINAGCPSTITGPNDVDIDGQKRIIGGRIDMGADEYAPLIRVTRPAGGEVWAAGSSHEIQWESFGIDNVDILFSTDGGENYEAVVEGLDAGIGRYMWQLPSKVDSNQCIISVEPSVEDESVIVIESGLFEINKLPRSPAVPPGQPDRNKQRRTGLSENIGPELGCIKWSFATGGPVTASVALGYNNRVYVPCEDGKLYALNNSGELIWLFDANSPLIGTPAIGYNGDIYVGADNGVLYALKNNGELLWSFATGGFLYGSPAVGPDGNICIGSTDGFLYALVPDGSELWKFKTAGFALLGNSIFASPAVTDEGTVITTGLYDPNLYGLDAETGSVKWVLKLTYSEPVCCGSGCFTYRTVDRYGWPFASSVLTDDGVIYQTVLYDPNLYAIDANDGSIIWTCKMKPQCEFLGQIFCGAYCYMLNALCGSDWYGVPLTEWYDCPPTGLGPKIKIPLSNCWTRPAVGPDGTIYVSFDDPYLRAVDPNGSIKWVKKIGIVGGFTLTVGPNGLIYAASDDGNMYVLNSDGDELSRFSTDEWLSWPVITVGGTVIVSDYNDTVWAIGGGDCSGGLNELHRPSDLTADGIVNMFDFEKLAADWAKTISISSAGPAYSKGDVNVDGSVDSFDLYQLAENWLKEE
jgi:predicted outer membrane repeat protein